MTQIINKLGFGKDIEYLNELYKVSGKQHGSVDLPEFSDECLCWVLVHDGLGLDLLGPISCRKECVSLGNICFHT